MKKADLQEIINKMDDDTELVFFASPTVKRFFSVNDRSKLVTELLDERGYIPQQTSLIASSDNKYMILLGADCIEIQPSTFMNVINNKQVEITRKNDETKS